MDKQKVKDAVKIILKEMGENIDREGIKATPDRIARLYDNIFYGYRKKLVVMNEDERNGELEDSIIPITIFKSDCKEMLIRSVKGISFCEHHITPFPYTAYVGIIPSGKLLGLNKIDRIVKYFGAQLQIQERFAEQIADWINDNISPIGVIVVVKGNHFCANLQGDEGEFITSAVRGEFFKPDLSKGNPREEFLKLIDMFKEDKK